MKLTRACRSIDWRRMVIPIEKCNCCRATAANAAVDWDYIPVPYFGKLTGPQVKVATIGLNPARNEIRLPQLTHYRKRSRDQLSSRDVASCRARREEYFGNLDSNWHKYFVSFESLLGRVNHLWSYARNMVHIDLVACPTKTRFSAIDVKARETLVLNCHPHFMAALRYLPEGTTVLLDGKNVCEQFFKLDLPAFDASTKPIPLSPPIKGWKGSVKINGRALIFAGWNKAVGLLKPLERIELAIWLRSVLGPSKSGSLHRH